MITNKWDSETKFNEVIVYKGSIVMKVRYFGEEGVDNIIEAMEDKIDLIAK